MPSEYGAGAPFGVGTFIVPPPRVPASVLARRLDWAALLERVFAIDVLGCTAIAELPWRPGWC